MPYANLGPLLGLFFTVFTGPLGFVLGLVLGLLGKGLRWRPAVAAWVLVACCLLLGAATYVACEPEDLWAAKLVDGTIVKCSPPIEFIDEVLTRWEKSIAINPHKIVAESWREDVRHTLSSASGYVATFLVEGTRDIYIGRKAPHRDATYPAPWAHEQATVRYFVTREMCPAGDMAERRVYLTDSPVWPRVERFPPDDASRLFNFSVLKPVPPSYAEWASP
jgi:hypothetical protein